MVMLPNSLQLPDANLASKNQLIFLNPESWDKPFSIYFFIASTHKKVRKDLNQLMSPTPLKWCAPLELDVYTIKLLIKLDTLSFCQLLRTVHPEQCPKNWEWTCVSILKRQCQWAQPRKLFCKECIKYKSNY